MYSSFLTQYSVFRATSGFGFSIGRVILTFFLRFFYTRYYYKQFTIDITSSHKTGCAANTSYNLFNPFEASVARIPKRKIFSVFTCREFAPYQYVNSKQFYPNSIISDLYFGSGDTGFTRSQTKTFLVKRRSFGKTVY